MNLQNRQPSNLKEILIFVAGTTPQIITETIYGLIHKEHPIYPDEIYILTTKHGKKTIIENLIATGLFEEFCKEFNLHTDILNEDSIKVITNEDEKELDDIKDWQDNKCAGDFIVNFIRYKAANIAARLHCSIAGGRKTMSFYLGSALQLFGRPWDKLYHVLVSSEFESHPEFYYKPKKDRILTSLNPPLSKGGKGVLKLNTKDAEIVLAELPFVKLRDKISLNGNGFRELVEESQKELDTAIIQQPITIHLSERTIYIGSTPIKLVPIQLMLYAAFLRQKLNRCKYPEKITCLNCTDCYTTIVDLSNTLSLEEMSNDYAKIYRQPLKAKELLNKHKDGLDPQTIRQNISKINKTIKEQIQDEILYPYYAITSVKRYADSRYGVRVEARKIQIE